MSIAQSVVKAHRGLICATTSCAYRTSQDNFATDISADITLNGDESSDSKPHGLTLTVVLPNVIIDDSSDSGDSSDSTNKENNVDKSKKMLTSGSISGVENNKTV